MRALLTLASGIDTLNEWIGRAACWLALIMILIGVYNASVRYLGAFAGANLSSNLYLEAQWYLFGALLMLGIAYTLRHDNHVRVDILFSRLGRRGQALVDLCGAVLLLMPFCALAIWLSLDWVKFSWAIRESSPNPDGLPRYPIKTLLPVGFGLLLLQGLAQAIRAAAVLTGHRLSHRPGDERGDEVTPL